ncbi:tyrosine-protein kinase domain-containing protein [Blastococcus deserti]|uniref:Wzz/FepE/Etk N-terminal domain-containing protein n=1 Tax=Blastococcus deserti TaxID=2259033 RepID=A0ABW4XAF1_9ACTN
MSDELIQLRDQVGVLRRRWYVIVATVLVCLALGWLYVSQARPSYVATAEVLLGAPTGPGNGLTENQVATEARAVTGVDSVSKVIGSLGLDEAPGDLVNSVAVEPDPTGASVLRITATRHDPSEAAAIANALSDQYLDGRARSAVQTAQILAPATPPESPASPRVTPTMALAGALGLLLGLGLAFLRHYFDQSVRDERDAVAATRRPVLGRIPHGRRAIRRAPVTLSAPESEASEAYRMLAATLRYRLSQIPPRAGQHDRGRVVLVTSASAAEGKTQTAVNTAVAASSAGLHVVLVDADFRDGGVDSLFELPPGPGVIETLTDSSDVRARLQGALVRTDLERLRVLPSRGATSRSRELMAAPRWASLLVELRATFDLVVIDSSPVLPVVDTLEIVGSADLTLLVVRRDVSRKEELAAAIERIEQVGGTVGGIVVCDVPRRRGARATGTMAARQGELLDASFDDAEEDLARRPADRDGARTYGAEKFASPRQSP